MYLKTFLFSLVSIFLFSFSLTAQQKTNFDGSWILNAQKTDFGKVDSSLAAASFVMIEQGTHSLELKRKFPNGDYADEVYQFDGTSIDTTMGAYKRMSFLKWSDDSKQFTISSVYNVTPAGSAPWQYTRKEIYSLSADGKSLMIERVSTFPDRTDIVKAVYDKK